MTVESTPPPPQVVDCRGMKCPAPILSLARAARAAGRSPLALEVLADDPDFPHDLRAWCRTTRARLVALDEADGLHRALLALNGAEVEVPRASAVPPRASAPPRTSVPPPASVPPRASVPPSARAADTPGASAAPPSSPAPAPPVALEPPLPATARGDATQPGQGPPTLEPPLPLGAAWLAPAAPKENRCALLVLRNDLESLLAALTVANGAAAQGMDTVVYFAFWGVNVLRGERPRPEPPSRPRTWLERFMVWLMPRGPRRQRLSKMHFAGAGTFLVGRTMRRQNAMGLPDLVDASVAQGVRFVVCTMSMGILGVERRDIMDLPNVEFAGVTGFVEEARRASVSLVF